MLLVSVSALCAWVLRIGAEKFLESRLDQFAAIAPWIFGAATLIPCVATLLVVVQTSRAAYGRLPQAILVLLSLLLCTVNTAVILGTSLGPLAVSAAYGGIEVSTYKLTWEPQQARLTGYLLVRNWSGLTPVRLFTRSSVSVFTPDMKSAPSPHELSISGSSGAGPFLRLEPFSTGWMQFEVTLEELAGMEWQQNSLRLSLFPEIGNDDDYVYYCLPFLFIDATVPSRETCDRRQDLF